MPPTGYKVGAAAARLGVHQNTLRLWCGEFGEFLSPMANPPSGSTRWINDDDLVVLTIVRDLRAMGRSRSAIVDALEAVAPRHVDSIQKAPTAPPDALDGDSTALAVVDALRVELTALQRRQDESALTAARAEGRASGFALGFTVAFLLFAGLMGGIVLLVAWLSP